MEKNEPTRDQTGVVRQRVIAYLFVGAGLTLCYAVIRGTTWHGSATLHTVMEAVATLLALTVGAMALVRFYSKKNNTFLFIGAGFLGTAFLDGYHAIVTSAAFKPFMPSDLPHLIPWSWVASRLFLSVFLFLSLIAWLREQRLGESGQISERSVYLFAGAFTLLSFAFFAFAPLPLAYYPELVFHRPEEFLPALFFLAALVGYLRKGDWQHDIFEHWLVLSLIVGFVGAWAQGANSRIVRNVIAGYIQFFRNTPPFVKLVARTNFVPFDSFPNAVVADSDAEASRQVRIFEYLDVQSFGDRHYPTRWVVTPTTESKLGHRTVIVVTKAVFDRPIEASRFSKGALKRYSR